MLNKEAAASEILKAVNNYRGVKTPELIRELIREFNLSSKEIDTMTKLIEELVQQHKLIEIEYTSDMSAVYSLLLPANTRINIKGQVPEPPKRV